MSSKCYYYTTYHLIIIVINYVTDFHIIFSVLCALTGPRCTALACCALQCTSAMQSVHNLVEARRAKLRHIKQFNRQEIIE